MTGGGFPHRLQPCFTSQIVRTLRLHRICANLLSAVYKMNWIAPSEKNTDNVRLVVGAPNHICCAY
jgi:hypothetical protein